LDSLGYGRPAEDHVGVRLLYSSQLLRLPPGILDEMAVIISPVPGRSTGMALFRNENNTWMFTIVGMVGREPPDELAEMMAFAREFTRAHVVAATAAGEPLAEVACYRMPTSQWRRFDKIRRFPAGSAGLRRRNLQLQSPGNEGGRTRSVGASTLFTPGEDGLARRYFRATAKVIGVAWQLAAGGDLSLPEVEGPRPVLVCITNKCVDRILAVAESEIVVAEQLTKIITLIDLPTRLLRRAVIARVARSTYAAGNAIRQPRQAQRFGDPQAVGNRQPRASAEAYPGELHCSTRKSANTGDVAVATGGSSSPQNRHDDTFSGCGSP
jgi:hypothetical protein